MKGMKRFLSLCALFAVLLPALACPPLTARAAERYAVAAHPDVWFYAAASESSRLFLIPYTYYVKIRSEGEIYTAVEYLTDDAPYKKVYGYCKTEELTFVDFIPERPYLRREITVSYSLPQAGNIGGGAFEKIERTFVYYGHRYEGAQLYFYVLSDGTFDYIPSDEELLFDYNTDYLEQTSGEEEGVQPSEKGLSGVEIAVIVVACAAALAVAVFVLKGKRPPVPEHEEAGF